MDICTGSPFGAMENMLFRAFTVGSSRAPNSFRAGTVTEPPLLVIFCGMGYTGILAVFLAREAAGAEEEAGEEDWANTGRARPAPSAVTAIMDRKEIKFICAKVKSLYRTSPRNYGPIAPLLTGRSPYVKLLRPIREVASSGDKSFRNPVVPANTAGFPTRLSVSLLHARFHIATAAAGGAAPGTGKAGMC